MQICINQNGFFLSSDFGPRDGWIENQSQPGLGKTRRDSLAVGIVILRSSAQIGKQWQATETI